MSNTSILMAMQAAPAGQASATTQLLMGIAPWLLIFVVFYLLMIRPQQLRVKQHQAQIAKMSIFNYGPHETQGK